jgi:hypothetical protein
MEPPFRLLDLEDPLFTALLLLGRAVKTLFIALLLGRVVETLFTALLFGRAVKTLVLLNTVL